MQNHSSTLQPVRDLVSQGQIHKACDKLRKYLELSQIYDFRDELILLSGRSKKAEEAFRNKLIGYNEWERIVFPIIATRLLEIVKTLEG